MQKSGKYMRMLVPALLALGAGYYFNNTQNQQKTVLKTEEILPERKEFDRTTRPLEYSKHALCRMECRDISEAEILEIRQNGKVNVGKSDFEAKGCPRWAVEGFSEDGQELRIVFAQCDDKMVVVTAIDIDKEHKCSCN